MTKQEAIEVIKLAQAQVEWEYPMDYAVAFDMAISALQAQDVPDTNVGKIDKYGYIGIETLLNFCDNSKYHAVAVTPNDFMRMKRVRMPEPCEDAVSRQDVIDAARKVHDIFEGEYDTRTPYGVILDVQDAVIELPSVTPKRKTGKWVIKKGVLHPLEIDGICSKCGYTTGFYTLFNFCPNCGAKMEGANGE